VDAGDVLRAVRRARRLSQRELAAVAGVPRSTVDRIEAGRTEPRLATFEAILKSVGYGLVITNQFGRMLAVDDGWLRDRGLRCYPAHLELRPSGNYFDGGWWGWGRLAWTPDDPKVPEYTFDRRYPDHWNNPDYAQHRWDDAT
jgi:transcriptional regulator with XRE-family HTH domain